MKGIIKATGEQITLCRKIFLNGVPFWTSFSHRGYFAMDEIELPNTDETEFIREFYTLIKKYGVTIGIESDPCSDWAGIYDARLIISLNDEKTIEFDDMWIDEDDVKRKL